MSASAEIFPTTSAKPKLNMALTLTEVQRRYRVGLLRQVSEIVRLRRGNAALSSYEYFYYGLFDPNLAWYDKSTFLGDERTRAIYILANKLTWWDSAEDKLLFHTLMKSSGFSVPEIYAVAHASRRQNGSDSLPDDEAVLSWLKSASQPVFGKPIVSNHGEGAIEILSIDNKSGYFTTGRKKEHALEDLNSAITPYAQGNGYIFQQVLRPHREIANVTVGRLSTLRIILTIGPTGPQVRNVICRLPSGSNTVDNFRRPGNLIASVDPETGELGSVTRGVGLDQEVLTCHPDSGIAFSEVRYPRVGEAIALAMAASQMFHCLHVQSWDIAVCEDGVYALEMNPGGNFNLVQLVEGKGVYTPDMQEFVRWCASLPLNSNDKARRRAVQIAT